MDNSKPEVLINISFSVPKDIKIPDMSPLITEALRVGGSTLSLSLQPYDPNAVVSD